MDMTQAQFTDPNFNADLMGLVQAERLKSVSRREWLHRLRGFGLGIEGDAVYTLRNRLTVCELPPHLCE